MAIDHASNPLTYSGGESPENVIRLHICVGVEGNEWIGALFVLLSAYLTSGCRLGFYCRFYLAITWIIQVVPRVLCIQDDAFRGTRWWRYR